jgi:hypothetical protein
MVTLAVLEAAVVLSGMTAVEERAQVQPVRSPVREADATPEMLQVACASRAAAQTTGTLPEPAPGVASVGS